MIELLLKDYRPESTLQTKITEINKPKFPAIDVHSHLEHIKDVNMIVKIMDEAGVSTVVNLTGGWGDILKERIECFDRKYPGRFLTFCNFDFSLIDSSEFNYHIRKTIEEGVRYGIRGVKIFKELGLKYRDSKGKLVLPDDDRLRVIWEAAAEANIPVLYHIADPLAFFQPISNKNERVEQICLHPDWYFYGSEFPERKMLLECQQKMLEQNPQTYFILPHIASNPEDLEYVSTLLDTYDNFVVDMSARVGDLGRQPYSARKFLIKYSNRILFGLDGSPNTQKYQISYRFFETDDEYFDFRLPNDKIIGRWKVYGVNLPDEVLKRIYYDNAINILGKI